MEQLVRRVLAAVPMDVGSQPLAHRDEVAALDALADVERLERMTERLLDATGWAEVLATP